MIAMVISISGVRCIDPRGNFRCTRPVILGKTIGGHVNVTPYRRNGRFLAPAAVLDFNDKRFLLRFHHNPVVRFSSKKQIASALIRLSYRLLRFQFIQKFRQFLGIPPVHANNGTAAHLGGSCRARVDDRPGIVKILLWFVTLSHKDENNAHFHSCQEGAHILSFHIDVLNISDKVMQITTQ
ncbi:hypothetical protein ACTJJ7_23435 [Phyllobacterium sp. 22229]|uniref:hypothetical protein n=1 Tax=Phyllobacterium sp. 22229 TaxID=3453895 RepID=UPI003F87A7BF